MSRKIEFMPNEYKGETYFDKHNGTYSRKWTEKEIDWLKYLIEKGYTTKEIAESMDRGVTSVSIKKKRIGKKDKTYNQNHIREKNKINKVFVKMLNPNSVLDLYNGGSLLYSNYNMTSNDIDKTFDTDYHKDAFKLICELYSKNESYDLIDLDPFGSAYDCFDLAIKMANKGLCITFGELGHKRWKRLDYVSRFYGINELENFELDALIKEVQKIGLRNKKRLKVYSQRDWGWIGRVWFTIEPMKIEYRKEMV